MDLNFLATTKVSKVPQNDVLIFKMDFSLSSKGPAVNFILEYGVVFQKLSP